MVLYLYQCGVCIHVLLLIMYALVLDSYASSQLLLLLPQIPVPSPFWLSSEYLVCVNAGTFLSPKKSYIGMNAALLWRWMKYIRACILFTYPLIIVDMTSRPYLQFMMPYHRIPSIISCSKYTFVLTVCGSQRTGYPRQLFAALSTWVRRWQQKAKANSPTKRPEK